MLLTVRDIREISLQSVHWLLVGCTGKGVAVRVQVGCSGRTSGPSGFKWGAWGDSLCKGRAAGVWSSLSAWRSFAFLYPLMLVARLEYLGARKHCYCSIVGSLWERRHTCHQLWHSVFRIWHSQYMSAINDLILLRMPSSRKLCRVTLVRMNVSD
jgi:hypothetical protein